MKIKTIAAACHEANRVLTREIGDVGVQPPWEECPVDQQVSCINGVAFRLRNPTATAAEMHENWRIEKVRDGWTLGPARDSVLKTHPALVDYAELPAAVKVKDRLFSAIVDALRE